MVIGDKLTSEEIETSNTQSPTKIIEEKTSTEAPAEADIKEEKIFQGSSSQKLTPMEISQKEYYDKKRIETEQRININNIIRKWLGVIGALVAFFVTALGIYFGYYISSVSEPVGNIKKGMEVIELDNRKINSRLDKVEDDISNTREEFLRSNISASK